MANYATLKAAIQNVVKTNGNNEITGALLQQTLLAMVNSLGVGYQYVGIATPATNPGTPDQNVFYIASTAGTYTNFGGLVLADGEIAILKYNGAWSKDSTGAASLENVNQLRQDLTGVIDKGTTYSEKYGTFNRTLVFYPLTDVEKNGEFCLSINDVVIPSGRIVVGTTNSISPFSDARVETILYVTADVNDFRFSLSEDKKAAANYLMIGQESANAELCSFSVFLSTDNNALSNIVKSQTEINSEQSSFNDEIIDYVSVSPRNIVSDSETIILRGWISYANGTLQGSSYFSSYQFKNYGYKWIKATLASGDNNPCAVAFYNSATPDANSYMQADSAQIEAGERQYFVRVPEGCVTMIVTNRTADLPNPTIKATNETVNDGTALGIGGVGSIYNKIWLEKPFYGHLWINSIDGSNPAIPCQSLFDIDATARLGFKYIEVNVLHTSDNVLIPLHGVQSAFGREVTDLNGDFTYENTKVYSVTYEWITQNIRYNSKYAKHRTTIPTLEEFLNECKRLGISVMITYNTTIYSLLQKYFGDNFIAYNGNRDDGFNGLIINYNSLSTIDEIVDECKRVHPPYCHMMSASAFQSFRAAGTLQELVLKVHEIGCMLGVAGCYLASGFVEQFFAEGGDISASDREVNDFEIGNICNLAGDVDYSQFTITGGAIAGGVITLRNDGQIVSPIYNSIFLGKCSLHIRFNGRIKIKLNGNTTEIASDGKQSHWLSSYILENTPNLEITSVGVTEVTSINYKASAV